MGDFNDMLHAEETIARIPHPQWLLRGFREAVDTSGLRDFKFEDYQFTWEKGRGSPNWIREKLDRILVNDMRLETFGDAKASSLEAPKSDRIQLALWPLKTTQVNRYDLARWTRQGPILTEWKTSDRSDTKHED
ncbi:uncharacterized protein LOC116024364 [Ipomoea triloba]|uniref:uncharacterized protein LOC116024364 n=1 Tax=Ipomoea triloba TaxID=35885 RepID=UPI00125DFF24|nr:uncharacterized protein LOC116024364 [Ipomoea triloba]